MTEQEVRKLIMAIRSMNYRWFEANDFTVAIWTRLLADENSDDIGQALASYMRTNAEDAPKPGALIDIARRAKEDPRPMAHEAWALLVEYAKRGAPWSEVCSEMKGNPRAISAARSVSYDRVRLADTESELPFVRRDFIQAYKDMIEAERQNAPVIEIKDARAKTLLENTMAKMVEVIE